MKGTTSAPSLAALEPANSCAPAAPWIGGKKLLWRRLSGLISAVPHDVYAEVFVGGGGVFLRREERPRCEVINDWSEDVSTFFRVLQRHYVAFLDMLRFQVTSRARFEQLAGTDPSTLTDLERSARFLYLQRLAFGGKVRGRNFGVTLTQSARFDVTKLGPVLEAIHERLAGVIIERLRWQTFLERYDRPGTLFYLDPPYYGSEDDYGKEMFDRAEFAEMAEQLASLRGRFILSINDHPEIRRIFAAFVFQEVETTYSVALKGDRPKARELIITGGGSRT
ncbi:DNA adenine methylase [Sphingomonas sp. SRS2]|uniref:DNA adenine methylase n=1 Tax=Sphingomonas sp. SRS2 TaxID=133190 RepID=UPI0006183ED7|nr:DNA adenine methylase [Sphingomonas sp. SRS2]KKC27414.1 DNA methyltransferase [Sphingomonas sp. SRS2]